MEQQSNGLNQMGKHEEAIAEAFKVYSLLKAITLLSKVTLWGKRIFRSEMYGTTQRR